MFSVYILTCKTSGKSYIGLTRKTAEKRWQEHLAAARRGVGFAIYRAIRKYGEEDWTVETIDRFADKKAAAAFEIQKIAEMNTVAGGYNMTAGGDGLLGLERTPEWRAKIAEANSKPCTEEKKRKLKEYRGPRSSFYGRKHSEETRRKMSEASSGELHPGYGRRGAKHHQAKTYIITYPNGTQEKITGLADFCRNRPEFNLKGWYTVLSGKASHYKQCTIRVAD